MASTSFSKVDEVLDTRIIQRDAVRPNTTLPEQTERAVNKFGQTYIKGGSALGESFVDAVITAYSNFVNSPFALATSIIGALGILAIFNNTEGPFEKLALKLVESEGDASSAHKAFNAFVLIVVSSLLRIKHFVYTLLLFAGPYIAKPSRRSLVMASMLSITLMLVTFSTFEIIALSQLFLLETQLRNPRHKALIWLISFILILIGFHMFNSLLGDDIKTKVYSLAKSGKSSAVPTPATVTTTTKKP